MENQPIQPNGQDLNKLNVSNKIKRVPHEGIFMSVTKKAEKITTAMYMLTDLITESDPMRRKMREISLLVMSDTRAVSSLLTGDLYFHLAKIISRSWELVSLLEVSVAVGFISDMNYSILKNALIDFIGDIRNKQRIESFTNIKDMKLGEGGAANINLKTNFFKWGDEEMSRDEEWQMYNEKRQTAPAISELSHTSVLREEKPVVKQPVSRIAQMAVRKFEIKEPVVRIKTPNEDRKAKILSLITEKKEISIKDITDNFQEYSQKTIQRELSALVASGQLKRTGDKRWSRYSLA